MPLRKSKKVLVLGEPATARPIAKELLDLGLDPIPLPPDFQKLRYRDSISTMREVLSWFYTLTRDGGWVHPGVSPWADRAELQTLGEELGLNIIGPSSRVLSLFYNKLNLLTEAERLGIPNLVMSYDPIHSIREVKSLLQKTRTFPFKLRSAKGGGRWSLFPIEGEEVNLQELELWLEQLHWNLGEVILFPERCLDLGRHYVVPFYRDAQGRIEIFPQVDASLKCENRKLVEYCLGDGDADQLRSATEFLAHSFEFVGVGSFEFAVNGGRPHLLDAYGRLNTSYQLWQACAGVSAVKLQVAAMKRSRKQSGSVVPNSKAAPLGIALKIYAEDALHHFPQVGKISHLTTLDPQSVSFSYTSGDVVSREDSGLLGLVFVFAENTEKLHAETLRVLSGIWISGEIQTNERFLAELLKHPWVQNGIYHSAFIREDFTLSVDPPQALLALAKQEVELGESGSAVLRGSKWWVRVGEWFISVRAKSSEIQKVEGVALRSLVTGRVHSILYRTGVLSQEGSPLIIVEVCGVLVPHTLSRRAKVKEWKIKVNAQVEGGQVLAILTLC